MVATIKVTVAIDYWSSGVRAESHGKPIKPTTKKRPSVHARPRSFRMPSFPIEPIS